MALLNSGAVCKLCAPKIVNIFRQRLNSFKQIRCLCESRSTSWTPLSGIRVLDLTRVLAGPYCTMILGDLGAEVIKVERPGHGDDTRRWGPPFVKTESAYFLSINRNKKSITVNIQKPEGAALIKQMAAHADVLVENYLPGKLAQYGLGYEDLQKEAPQLIYCSITGYGQKGPYQKRAGYDVIAAGLGGLLHITGPEDGEPCRVGVAMTDLSTGLYAYGAIMAALLHRQKSGRGQHIDCNLLATQVATISHIASNYLNVGQEASRYGTGHESIVPYQAFQTKDGYIVIGAGNNDHFKTLCKRIELEELLQNPDYASNEERVKHRKQLLSTLSERFAKKTTADWLATLEGCGIPYGPINNMQQVFSDPQVLYSGLIQEMNHPTVGQIRIPGPAVKYSDSEVVLQSPPPTLGQHTNNVLQELLNLSQSEIDSLKSSGAI